MINLKQRQFDVNLWNRGAYETAHLAEIDQYDEWVLCPYTIVNDGWGGYGTGQEHSELNMVLTPKEWTQMTLGVAKEDGGVYHSDDDFWLDSYTLQELYKLPASVQVWIDFVSAVIYNGEV